MINDQHVPREQFNSEQVLQGSRWKQSDTIAATDDPASAASYKVSDSTAACNHGATSCHMTPPVTQVAAALSKGSSAHRQANERARDTRSVVVLEVMRAVVNSL
jgi:hypothetical protein